MRGVILDCLSKLVITHFGEDIWEKTLENAGYDPQEIFIALIPYDDEKALNIISSLCQILNITLEQAADAFGDYWMNEYAIKMFKPYYEMYNSSREFLLAMDNIHKITTNTIPDAKPPKFTYKWENDNTLLMTYESQRNLLDFAVGLARGVGKYFNENLIVSKFDEKTMKIIF